jgi:hypothetical protein
MVAVDVGQFVPARLLQIGDVVDCHPLASLLLSPSIKTVLLLLLLHLFSLWLTLPLPPTTLPFKIWNFDFDGISGTIHFPLAGAFVQLLASSCCDLVW